MPKGDLRWKPLDLYLSIFDVARWVKKRRITLRRFSQFSAPLGSLRLDFLSLLARGWGWGWVGGGEPYGAVPPPVKATLCWPVSAPFPTRCSSPGCFLKAGFARRATEEPVCEASSRGQSFCWNWFGLPALFFLARWTSHPGFYSAKHRDSLTLAKISLKCETCNLKWMLRANHSVLFFCLQWEVGFLVCGRLRV